MRLTSLVRLIGLRLGVHQPGWSDVPALVAAAALLVCAAPALGVWGTTFCALGVLAAAASTMRWPATLAAVGIVAAVAVDGQRLVVVGLLTAAYLVLLSGVPGLDGIATLAVGVGGSILVTALALAVVVPASVWWVLPTAVAVPLLLAAVAGPRSLMRGTRTKG